MNFDKTLIEQFREELPFAAGSKLPLESLYSIRDQALKECAPILDRTGPSWLNHPSIANALLLLSYIYGDELRVYGGKKALTHPLKVAQSTVSFPGFKNRGYDPVFLAFIAILHDALEDCSKGSPAPFNTRTPEKEAAVMSAIHKCWVGDYLSIKAEEKLIYALTDSRNKHGFVRREEQIDRAIEYGEIVAVIRLADKTWNALDDFETIFNSLVRNTPLLETVNNETNERRDSGDILRIASRCHRHALNKKMVVDGVAAAIDYRDLPFYMTIKSTYKNILSCLETATKLPQEKINQSFFKNTMRQLIDISPKNQTLESVFFRGLIVSYSHLAGMKDYAAQIDDILVVRSGINLKDLFSDINFKATGVKQEIFNPKTGDPSICPITLPTVKLPKSGSNLFPNNMARPA